MWTWLYHLLYCSRWLLIILFYVWCESFHFIIFFIQMYTPSFVQINQVIIHTFGFVHIWYIDPPPPANTKHWPYIGLKLAQPLRRWPKINPTLVQCIEIAGPLRPSYCDFNFKFVVLENTILQHSWPSTYKKVTQPCGWNIHYVNSSFQHHATCVQSSWYGLSRI